MEVFAYVQALRSRTGSLSVWFISGDGICYCCLIVLSVKNLLLYFLLDMTTEFSIITMLIVIEL